MKPERVIQRIRALLERTDDTKRLHELLFLLSLVKDDRIEELEKQLTEYKLKKYRNAA